MNITADINSQTNRYTWLYDLLLLALGIGIVYFIFLGDRPLSVPDEARYAEIPREMLILHDYITPHLNFVKYFEKPPLFYWLQVAAIKLFGVNELAIRIPNTLMALFGCLITYGIGRIIYDRRTGILAALILASSALYFVLGHLVTLDMTLSTMIAGCLLCFLSSIKLPSGISKRLISYGMYLFAAGALLTKGLVGILLPGTIIFLWLLIFNQWKLLKTLYLPTGILIFLAVALPWHILVQIKNPEFFNFYFINQQFVRYLTLDSGRYQPDWFFVPIVLLGFLPWVIFLIPALCKAVKNCRQHFQLEKYTVFLLLWPTLIFLFFSFSHSKLIPYILPILPALAVITGHYFAEQWQTITTKSLRVGYWILLAILLIGAVGVTILQYVKPVPEITQITSLLALIIGIWLAGFFLATRRINQQQPAHALQVLLLSTLLAYIIVPFAIPKVDSRSVYSLAMTLKPLLTTDSKVVAFDKYYQDLPFYLRERITIVDTLDELEFGTHHQDTSSWMLNQPKFWPQWESNQPVYMIMDIDTYHELKKLGQHHFYFIARTKSNVLLSNKPLA